MPRGLTFLEGCSQYPATGENPFARPKAAHGNVRPLLFRAPMAGLAHEATSSLFRD
ncbi:hypothetical protein D3C81_527360 [compost metagenome]